MAQKGLTTVRHPPWPTLRQSWLLAGTMYQGTLFDISNAPSDTLLYRESYSYPHKWVNFLLGFIRLKQPYDWQALNFPRRMIALGGVLESDECQPITLTQIITSISVRAEIF